MRFKHLLQDNLSITFCQNTKRTYRNTDYATSQSSQKQFQPGICIHKNSQTETQANANYLAHD